MPAGWPAPSRPGQSSAESWWRWSLGNRRSYANRADNARGAGFGGGREPAVLTIEDMRAVAAQRGGECLSGPFTKRRRTKLEFRCAHGHQWTAVADNVFYNKTWCPFCSGHAKTIADMQALAAKRGGTCLSD